MHPDHGYILSFPENLILTDNEFFEFCQANPDLNLERDEHKRILIMSPTGSLSGGLHSVFIAELFNWNRIESLGKVFDSSAGFTLPDGSVKSPDCAWVSNERWQKLSREEKLKFAPVCPEFVVEVKSPTDSLDQLKSKMIAWIANGAQLGWLVDVENETVYVFSTEGLMHTVSPFNQKLTGGTVLPEFSFDLSLLKEE